MRQKEERIRLRRKLVNTREAIRVFHRVNIMGSHRNAGDGVGHVQEKISHG